MKTSFLNLRSLLALLAGLLWAGALWAAPNQWNTSGGPMDTGLGNRVISAMTVSADGKTIYAGTGSGTLFSYDVPPALSAVGVSGTTQTATTLSATSDKNATGYWIVVARNATVPTSAQVKAGVSYGGVTIVAAGSGAMSAAVAATFAVGGLTAGTDYDLYFIAEDGGGNQSAPAAQVQFATPVTTYAIATAASPLAGGTASCTPNPVDHGATATCTATANAGYSFANWSGDCTGAICTLANVTAAKSVTANFSVVSYAITAAASPSGGGTVSCAPNPVAHGGGSTCTATANAGYSFTNWGGDCTGATCTLANVTAARNVTANFSLNTYTIGGTVSGLAAGQNVVLQNNGGNDLTVNASGAFTFGTSITHGGAYAVTVSTQPTGQTCTVANGSGTATAKVSNVSVNCNAVSYAITTAANPAAGGTVSCAPNPVGHGASSTCTATPHTGYSFTNWSGDCTGATCTLANVTSAKSVTANFTLLGTKTYTGPSATGSGTITASFTGGGAACGYTVSRFIAVSVVPTSSPAGVNFPHGLFDFTAGGCTPGSMLSFTITFPQALAPNTQYWKFGPTPDKAAPHWYVLPATIAGNTASFSITDGGLGDDDLAVNGIIVDQGGPGGSDLAAIPTLSRGALVLLSALLIAFGVIARRRQQRRP